MHHSPSLQYSPGMAGSTRDTWDRAAPSYDVERAQDPVYQAVVNAACAAIEGAHASRVLDVGCGTGFTTSPLCRPQRLVVGCDYSHVSLRLLQGKHTAAKLTQGDVCALAFPDECFEAILCANTLQHLAPTRQKSAIGELTRVLAPGGLLVVTVHHYSRSKRAAGWIKEGRPGQAGIDYIFRFSRDDLRRLLPRADVYAVGVWPSIEPLLPRTVMWLAGLGGLGHMLMAIYKKAVPQDSAA